MLEFVLVNPTRAVAMLQGSMVYIDYRLHYLVDLSLDVEVEAKGLCSLKWKEVHYRMERQNNFLKKMNKNKFKWIMSRKGKKLKKTKKSHVDKRTSSFLLNFGMIYF